MSVDLALDVGSVSGLGNKRGFAPGLNSPGLAVSEQTSLFVRSRRYQMLNRAKSLLPSNKGLSACNRLIVPNADGVELRRRVDKQGNAHASWAQLCTCGLVWVCPVCSARISQGRAREFDEMIAQWTSRGNSVVFETFTMQYHAGESIKDVMSRYEQAWRLGWHGRPWERLRRDLRIWGVATAREVTRGSKGWHAHKHRLTFVEGQADIERFDQVNRSRWLASLLSVGAYGNEHAYSVRGATDAAAEYFAKWQHEPSRELPWGAAHEFTSAHAKSARAGKTPFQLLEDAMLGDLAAVPLFLEYVEGFKGKMQIVCTRGMRDELLPGQPEKTDDELAALPEGDSYLWRWLSRVDWQMLYAQGLRGEFERLCVENDHTGARVLLESIHALMSA